MIDTVYKTLLTIINKENQGYINPTEFNLMANQVQMEIFRGYFEDLNKDLNRENRGLTNRGYADLVLNERQRIQNFTSIITIPKDTVNNIFPLPIDLYFIEDDGVVSVPENPTQLGKLIEEVEIAEINYLLRSESAPTSTYPIYEKNDGRIKVYPNTIENIELRYLRTPKQPKWTYTVVQGREFYDPSNPSFQDFELHESEFTNIVMRLLSYFGINLREEEIIKVAESLKANNYNKENN